MLVGGAPWAVDFGWGEADDLKRLEDGGHLDGADPGLLSSDALRRQREEFGTLGGGEHAIEILEVATGIDAEGCRALGLTPGGVVVTIDSGSRGLGSQVVVDTLRAMVAGADAYGLAPAERDLACARASSEPALRWSASVAAAGNAALANRQALTHVVRQIAARFMDGVALRTVFDASRDTCRDERLDLDGETRALHVHRRGAVRLLGPEHPALPEAFSACGQPVLIRGGIGAWPVLSVAVDGCEQVALASGPASSGRLVGRHAAWQRQDIDTVARLKSLGLVLRCLHPDGLLPELAEAFRSVDAVVDAARQDGLLRPVARLRPLACVHV
jgi:tRNA-splicing ligase RtcB